MHRCVGLWRVMMINLEKKTLKVFETFRVWCLDEIKCLLAEDA